MKFWLRLVISIVLLVVLFRVTNWRDAMEILADTRPVTALIALALCIIGLIMSAVRWNVLVRAHNIRISNALAIRCYWVGAFFGNFLPSNIGGDVVRIVVMKRPDKLAQIGASIIVERITGLVIILFLVICSLLLHAEYYAKDKLFILVWLGVGGLTLSILVVVLAGKRVSLLMYSWGRRDGSWIRRGIDKFRKLVDNVNYYGKARGAVFLTTVWAVFFYVDMVTFHYFSLVAVGAHLPWFEVLFIAPLIPLVSFLPISVNAIGVAEGTFVFFYAQAGVPVENALAAALLLRLIMTFTSLLGGLFWLQDKEKIYPD